MPFFNLIISTDILAAIQAFFKEFWSCFERATYSLLRGSVCHTFPHLCTTGASGTHPTLWAQILGGNTVTSIHISWPDDAFMLKYNSHIHLLAALLTLIMGKQCQSLHFCTIAGLVSLLVHWFMCVFA
jgi:hypothetical protein